MLGNGAEYEEEYESYDEYEEYEEYEYMSSSDEEQPPPDIDDTKSAASLMDEERLQAKARRLRKRHALAKVGNMQAEQRVAEQRALKDVVFRNKEAMGAAKRGVLRVRSFLENLLRVLKMMYSRNCFPVR
jgi:hypothetical protein